jgi:hypothetical protein
MENTMEIKEKRGEERFHYKIPEFVYAEFRVGEGPERDKVYDLKVMNSSKYSMRAMHYKICHFLPNRT